MKTASRMVASALALVSLAACSAPQGRTATSATATNSGRYTIRLYRPFVAGAHLAYEVGATERMQTSLTVEGVPPHNEDQEQHAQMAAHAVIDTVDPHGVPIHTRFTIDRFTFEVPGRPNDTLTLHSGQVLDVTRSGQAADAEITLDGAPATRELRQAVELLIRLDSSPTAADDVFGSRQPRAPGESWAIDSDRAAQAFAEVSAMRGRFTGATRLLGTTTVRNVPCLALEMSLDGDLDAVPGLPQGLTMDHARFTSQARVVLPLDEHAPPVQTTTETRAVVDTHGTLQGHPATLHLVHSRNRSVVTLGE